MALLLKEVTYKEGNVPLFTELPEVISSESLPLDSLLVTGHGHYGSNPGTRHEEVGKGGRWRR
jgi:hypothetical protein